MPGALLKGLRNTLILAGTLAALLASSSPWAAGGTAQVSVAVPAGKTKTIRLRNLPRGTDVSVRIEADGALVVALISHAELRSRNPQALFKAALERSMAFKVVTTESSHYYLVLDNRRGPQAVNARATIDVRRDSKDASQPST